MTRRCRAVGLVAALVLIAGACAGSTSEPSGGNDTDAAGPSPAVSTPPTPIPTVGAPAPEVPDGPSPAEAVEGVERILATLDIGVSTNGLAEISTSGDPRLGWILADFVSLMAPGQPITEAFVDAAEAVTGAQIDRLDPWRSLANQLITWDLPASPEYARLKGQLFTALDDRWAFVFSDPDSEIDYRLLAWGGVLIDDRELGDPEPCRRSCIPALDDPALTDAAGGDWYPDDGVVFGVIVGDEAVAFPRNIMEVHEMVNITIGGRRIGMPYCTLCGSAQAFLTDVVDSVDEVSRPLVLRTSGLLSRSNKVTYDLDTRSVFDTFTGRALSGPLHDAGLQLEQIPVVTTTWADWRATNPATRIIAEDGGIGRTYDLDPLRGRDDDGPIFPIGPVDPRLPVQEQVVGVVLDDGTPVAFPADAARAALLAGDPVELGDVVLVLEGNGLVAIHAGATAPSHQAFWFAWSQFHPDTLLWER